LGFGPKLGQGEGVRNLWVQTAQLSFNEGGDFPTQHGQNKKKKSMGGVGGGWGLGPKDREMVR